jgi:hypothetical protein
VTSEEVPGWKLPSCLHTPVPILCVPKAPISLPGLLLWPPASKQSPTPSSCSSSVHLYHHQNPYLGLYCPSPAALPGLPLGSIDGNLYPSPLMSSRLPPSHCVLSAQTGAATLEALTMHRFPLTMPEILGAPPTLLHHAHPSG